MKIEEADSYFRNQFEKSWKNGSRWWERFVSRRAEWEKQKRSLFEFSETWQMVDHGWDHANALYASLPRFLWAMEAHNGKKILDNGAELFAFMAAAYLHDVGMHCLSTTLNGEFKEAARNPTFPYSSEVLLTWLNLEHTEEELPPSHDAIVIRRLHPEIGAWMCESGDILIQPDEKKTIGQIVFRHAKRTSKNGGACGSMALEGGPVEPVRTGFIASLIALADSCQLGGLRITGWEKHLKKLESEIKIWEKVQNDMDSEKQQLKEWCGSYSNLLRVQIEHIYKHLVVGGVSLGPDGFILIPAGTDVEPSWFTLKQYKNFTREALLKLAHEDINGELGISDKDGGVSQYFSDLGIKLPEIPLVNTSSWENINKSLKENDKLWEVHIRELYDKEKHSKAILPKPLKKREDFVPAHFREELENYVVPTIKGKNLAEEIENLVSKGENVFVMGESGMGKSLLLAYSFLQFKGLSSYYTIDRTQGLDVYRSEYVLCALRERAVELMELQVSPPAKSESKAGWIWEREYLETVLRAFSQESPDQNLVIFLDGLDENYLETRESDFILNILKCLIQDKELKVVWILSSQSRPGVEWTENYFTRFLFQGLERMEAERLLLKHLPEDFYDKHQEYISEFLNRAEMGSGYYDPEMIAITGRAFLEKHSQKVSFISSESFRSFIDALPLNYREKYDWLFSRYTESSKFKDVPSLQENAKRWSELVPDVPYNRFLYDIFAVLALIREPIPLAILSWALEKEDPNPKKDFRGRKVCNFKGYPISVMEENSFLFTAIRDLQRFIKIVDEKEKRFSFCKEAVRESFMKFSEKDGEIVQSARARLTALAMEEMALVLEDNLASRPDYMMTELLFLGSQDRERAKVFLDKLLRLPFLPEWLEAHIKQRDLQGANRGKSAGTPVSSFVEDLGLFDAIFLDEGLARQKDLICQVLVDWQYPLNAYIEIIASFVRNHKDLTEFWPPNPKDASGLLSPRDGYGHKVKGHTGPVTCMVVLPDGRLASGSEDHTIRIWDINAKTSIVLEGHNSKVIHLAAFPDGRLASASESGEVRVWNIERKTSKKLENNIRLIKSLAVIYDRYLALFGNDNSYCYDTYADDIEIDRAAFFIGNLVIYSSKEVGLIDSYGQLNFLSEDVAKCTTDKIQKWWEYADYLRFAINSGEQLIAACLIDKETITDLEVLIDNHLFPPREFTLTTEEVEYLLCGVLHDVPLMTHDRGFIKETNGFFILENMSTEEKKGVLEFAGRSGFRVVSLDMCENSVIFQFKEDAYLYWISWKGTGDVKKLQFSVRDFQIGSDHILKLLPNCRLAITDSFGRVQIINLNNQHEELFCDSCFSPTTDFIVLPDGRVVLNNRKNNNISVYDISKNEHTVILQTGDISPNLFILRENLGVIYGDNDETVVDIWDVFMNKKCARHKLKGFWQNLTSVITNPYDEYIMILDLGNIVFLNLASGEIIEPDFKEMEKRSYSFDATLSEKIFLVDGNWAGVFKHSDHGQEQLWILDKEGNIVNNVNYDGRFLLALPDGRLAYISSSKNRQGIVIRDANLRECDFYSTDSLIQSIYNFPQNHLAAACVDNSIRLWNLESGDCKVFQGHSGIVQEVIALPNERLASAGQDKTIRVWDMATREQTAIGFFDGLPSKMDHIPVHQTLLLLTSTGLKAFKL
ncbi:MAG: WD40 repeat domain-containing protein [Nitrospinae bacterium]|nr:WD40 repeat domain-containing protein [Nitrospinota bacterium]